VYGEMNFDLNPAVPMVVTRFDLVLIGAPRSPCGIDATLYTDDPYIGNGPGTDRAFFDSQGMPYVGPPIRDISVDFEAICDTDPSLANITTLRLVAGYTNYAYTDVLAETSSPFPLKNDGELHDYTWVIAPDEFVTDLATVRSAMAAGAWAIEFEASPARNIWLGDDLTLDVHIGHKCNVLNPLRRYPPVGNGGFGPTRHYPPPVARRRVGGSY
jgi:hypothetical protein